MLFGPKPAKGYTEIEAMEASFEQASSRFRAEFEEREAEIIRKEKVLAEVRGLILAALTDAGHKNLADHVDDKIGGSLK